MTEQLEAEFLFEMTADVNFEGFSRSGVIPEGSGVAVFVTGGKVEGPRVRGVVLPNSTNQTAFRPDGSLHLDVRVAIRTHDEQLIHAHYRGLHVIPPPVLQRMIKGQRVDPSEYYLRVTPVFETTAEKYGWLSRLVAVGIGQITPTGIAYRVYKLL